MRYAAAAVCLRFTAGVSGIATAIALLGGCSDASRPSGEGWQLRNADPATSGDGSGPGPCHDGDVHCCAITLASHNNITACAAGTHVCSGGHWGPCTADTVSIESKAPAPASTPGLTPSSLSPPQACENNPCDPYCQQYNEAPQTGYSPPQTVLWSVLAGSLSNLPSGFVNKALKDASHPPKYSACTGAGDCEFDYHCDTATGNCVPWTSGDFDKSCAQMDLTLGPTCNNTIPVCNRGSMAAPAGVEVVVFNGNSSQMQGNMGSCSNFQGSVVSRCKTLDPIPPGGCINVAGCSVHGTESIVVNPPPPAGTQQPFAECNCGNNWTVYSNGGACAPVTRYQSTPLVVKQQYEGLCAPGEKVQWGFLTWDGTAPSNASGSSAILIQAHAAELAANLKPTCSDCVTLGDVPVSAPAICTVSGPAPCPIDVYAALGGMTVGMSSFVELVFTLQATPDSSLLPTLTDWKLTYSCPAME
jgi:hypothetical protein